MDKKQNFQYRSASSFSIEERRKIVDEYLAGGYSKAAIWKKYTGQDDEHGVLLRWMRQLGLISKEKTYRRSIKKSSNLPLESFSFVRKEEKDITAEDLKKRIKELEKQLETAQLKAEGYEIMIEIAEKQLNIPIRKKSDTK